MTRAACPVFGYRTGRLGYRTPAKWAAKTVVAPAPTARTLAFEQPVQSVTRQQAA
ncbi:hypothetical protein GCM10022408_15410 [Hymenobacter fastidiosus]|uniref:Uncharacterized protein n=1 Tax=Hymenobacter fastidiosus TaxID=486264 RepID=A0ABP7RZX5_9BACT